MTAFVVKCPSCTYEGRKDTYEFELWSEAYLCMEHHALEMGHTGMTLSGQYPEVKA